MTKKEILKTINDAKIAHKRWMSYAKALHIGIPVDKNAIPLIETDCQFGKWYYGSAHVFSYMDSYKAIEEPHTLLHKIYMQLYKERRKPLETGLFVSKKSAMKKKQEKLDQLMNQLMHISELLLEALEHFENDIRNLNEFELERHF